MRRIHHEIRALALFGIGQLPRQNGVERLVASWCRAPGSARAAASGDVVTTTTASTRFSPPVSNSSGISITTTGAPDAFGLIEEFLAGGAEHRVNDLLELLDGRGIVHHLGGQLLRDRPCHRRSCREMPPRSPAPPRLHRFCERRHRRRKPARPPPRTALRWWIFPSRSSRSVRVSASDRRFQSDRFRHRAAPRRAGTPATATAAGREW